MPRVTSVAALSIAATAFLMAVSVLLPGQQILADAGGSLAAESPIWHVVAPPDQSDWSDKRRAEYAKYQAVGMGTPEAVLRFPTLALTVPVFSGTDRMSLELGAGWVHDTSHPGEAGNVAIAGHRDSFFRSLENIEVGAQIYLTTASATLSYEVSDISIVDALDISVLQPTQYNVLTLITCHPFRYKGFAPDRYFVRARLSDERPH